MVVSNEGGAGEMGSVILAVLSVVVLLIGLIAAIVNVLARRQERLAKRNRYVASDEEFDSFLRRNL